MNGLASIRLHPFVLAAVAIALIAVGVFVGSRWSGDESAATEDAGGDVLYWYDPMVPDQHFDQPGKSPFMDMMLVPKYADESRDGGIAIAPQIRQNLGMRTALVERGRLSGAVRVPATVAWDLRREHVVSARVDAIVERLLVKAPYQRVRKGEVLARIVAPSWSTALAEAAAVDDATSTAAGELRAASQARLRALGLPPGATIRDGRIAVTAPENGVVSEIGVREGEATRAGTLLFRVNGTATVWVEASIPQAALAGIQAGTLVAATLDARPGQRYAGQVETLLPQIDPATRAQRARIVLENPDGELVPGMYAQIELRPSEGAESLLVATEAVIGTGRDTRVIVVDESDALRPVLVATGRSGDGRTEILSGLKAGDRVVTSGQFLIDSEASLSGALERLAPGPPP